MKRAENRPAIHTVFLMKNNGIKMKIVLFASNLPFYGFANLDWGRFERSSHSLGPALVVTLEGPQDPIWNQVANLISAPIKEVNRNGILELGTIDDLLGERARSSFVDLSVCAQLMRDSTIEKFKGAGLIVNETTVSSIIIASRTKKFIMAFDSDSELADQAAFIAELNSVVSSSVCISDYIRTLPRIFWQKFLNENLANGSFEYAVIRIAGARAQKFMKAEIDLPVECELVNVEWHKKA
ncbi:hypothetical protein PMAYCL1PPCAC_27442 [Pristionchus mayeri]|uniref:Uncharacterized protein n=1 Tax=Pristionchus mayeri TaxID=1317129 RepID=A0AAN5D7Q1_9BILA|nr:hypothetical protein PMAYCL1PPCAC_27442 [Pristionchus mayeri]